MLSAFTMSADSVAAVSVASIGNNNSLFALLAFFALIMFFCMIGCFVLVFGFGFIWFSSGGSDSSAGGREHSSSWWYSWCIPGKTDASSASEKEEISALKKEIDALRGVYDDRVSTLESKLANVDGEITAFKKLISELTSLLKVIETYLGENFLNRNNEDFVAKYGREATIDDYDYSERVNSMRRQLMKLQENVDKISCSENQINNPSLKSK